MSKIKNVRLDGVFIIVSFESGNSEKLNYGKTPKAIGAWKYYTRRIGEDYVRPSIIKQEEQS